jgi:hypothetical protein
MKRKIKAIAIFFSVFFFIPAGSHVYAQSCLVDPGIPDGEKITYTLYEENKPATVITETTTHKQDTGGPAYEIHSLSTQEDMTVILSKATMLPSYSEVTAKKPDSLVNTKTTILKNEVKTAGYEIPLLDFRSLAYVLRGFPFGAAKSLKIKTGQEGNFTMIVTMLEQTTVKIKDNSYKCFKLEISIDGMGLLGAFFPKPLLWYSVEAPHYLVRSEGSSMAPGGGSKRTLEIAGYENAP